MSGNEWGSGVVGCEVMISLASGDVHLSTREDSVSCWVSCL